MFVTTQCLEKTFLGLMTAQEARRQSTLKTGQVVTQQTVCHCGRFSKDNNSLSNCGLKAKPTTKQENEGKEAIGEKTCSVFVVVCIDNARSSANSAPF